MAKDSDLETLREILMDKRVSIACAEILQLDLVSDRSVWRAKCKAFPEGHEIIARMTWEATGPSAGIFGPAQVGDFVLVAMADKEEDASFVIRRLTSKVDKIPAQAADFHTVIKALAGKKLYLGSDIATLIGKITDEGADPDEPLVLGTELKTLLSSVLAEISSIWAALLTHMHPTAAIGPPSPPSPPFTTTVAASKATIDSLKASPVDDGKMNSDIAFTEKGS